MKDIVENAEKSKEEGREADREEVPEEELEEIIEVEEREETEKERDLEEEILEEKFFTIPLGRAWISPRKKRAPKAIRIIKSFIKKHMKLQTKTEGEEKVEGLVISNEVNEKIWSRGIEKPPRKISVRAVKDKEGVTTVHLAEGD